MKKEKIKPLSIILNAHGIDLVRDKIENKIYLEFRSKKTGRAIMRVRLDRIAIPRSLDGHVKVIKKMPILRAPTKFDDTGGDPRKPVRKRRGKTERN